MHELLPVVLQIDKPKRFFRQSMIVFCIRVRSFEPAELKSSIVVGGVEKRAKTVRQKIAKLVIRSESFQNSAQLLSEGGQGSINFDNPSHLSDALRCAVADRLRLISIFWKVAASNDQVAQQKLNLRIRIRNPSAVEHPLLDDRFPLFLIHGLND